VAYRLLLADDSITIQKVVELILTEEDFEIKTTANGEEALAAIHDFKPDVVLADVDMPKMNGYQLCEKIKQDPSTGGIPVILLTGAFEPIDEELVSRVGADDFITKPFESQELISKVNAALAVSAMPGVEEIEAVVEAEEFVTETGPEEDLWDEEDIPEVAEIESWSAEEVTGAATEELLALSEEEEFEAEAIAEEGTVLPAAGPGEALKTAPVVSAAEIPATDELQTIFRGVVDQRIKEALSSLDLKDAVLTSLTPLLKDSVEKILWEVAPDLVERMLREMLKGSLESLTKEVEKVIWETVPDLAETMISKEIERIRSEF
jgi:CheY-like chemotaxis protein